MIAASVATRTGSSAAVWANSTSVLVGRHSMMEMVFASAPVEMATLRVSSPRMRPRGRSRAAEAEKDNCNEAPCAHREVGLYSKWGELGMARRIAALPRLFLTVNPTRNENESSSDVCDVNLDALRGNGSDF